jgi:hypothetical protein
VPLIDPESLTHKAIEHFNRIRAQTDAPASEASGRRFLDRLRVNYLRHQLTHYHQLLRKTYGKVGAPGAYLEIKAMVLTAIAATYPDLAEECARQKQRALREA